MFHHNRAISLLCILWFALVFFFITIIVVDARTFHVTEKGTGAACTTQAPCTVYTAIDKAIAGDIIQFAPGNCRCGFNTKRPGVTFRGAPNHKTRLLASSRTLGNEIVGIHHSDTVLEYLDVDGERKPNSGHGLVRVGTKERELRDIHIHFNRIRNSGNTLISVGGSIKESRIRDFWIVGNLLCDDDDSPLLNIIAPQDAGFHGFGEAIYLGDHKGTGLIRDGFIHANELCRFTDNGIDLKPPTRNIDIRYNLFRNQIIRRKGDQNYGTLVAQGSGHQFRENRIVDVVGGTSVFNLVSGAGIRVQDNVIMRVRDTETLVRRRGDNDGTPTIVTKNAFCDVNTKRITTDRGLRVNNNQGLDTKAIDCNSRFIELSAAAAEVLALYKDTWGEVDTGPQLPALTITNILYTRYGENDIRLWFQTSDGSPAHPEKRQYQKGAVTFSKLDGTPLPYRKSKPAGPGDGWVWYLDTPWPKDEDIRMRAADGWLTGAPAVDRVINNWQETEPIVELKHGQAVLCDGELKIRNSQAGHVIVVCEALR